LIISKKLLIIAAVAVMLVGATSAYGDYTEEGWNGWWLSGTLTYNSHDYTAVDTGYVSDSTFSDTTDTFYLPQDVIVNFIYVVGEIEDTIEFEDTMFTGRKPTGESGTKEGSGVWSGLAIHRRSGFPPDTFTIWGTWESTGNHFNYNTRPPTYTASWLVTGSYPDGITGGGTCSGYRTYYE
jgi:hypothetical protein